MALYNHPPLETITLDNILYALSDSVRREMFYNITRSPVEGKGLCCNETTEVQLSPATLSFNIRILRDSGLIFSEKKGVSVINKSRWKEIDTKFPDLLKAIYYAQCKFNNLNNPLTEQTQKQ